MQSLAALLEEPIDGLAWQWPVITIDWSLVPERALAHLAQRGPLGATLALEYRTNSHRQAPLKPLPPHVAQCISRLRVVFDVANASAVDCTLVSDTALACPALTQVCIHFHGRSTYASLSAGACDTVLTMLEHPGITTLHLSSEANDYKPPRSLSTQLLHWLTHAPCTSLTLSGVAINLRGQPQVGDAICDAIAASTLCTLRLFSVKHFDAAVLHGRRLPASLESFEWVAPGDEKTLAPATLAHLARALEGAPSLVHLGCSLTYLGQLGSCSWLDPVLARLTSLRALGSYNDASFATVRVKLVNIEKISLRKAATSYTQYTELVGALPQLPRLVELDMRDNTLYREDIGRILAAVAQSPTLLHVHMDGHSAKYEDFFHFVPEIVACTRHLTTLSLTPQHTEKRKDIECKAALLRILTIVEEPMFRLHPDVSANVPRSTLESIRSLMSRTSEDTCLLLF